MQFSFRKWHQERKTQISWKEHDESKIINLSNLLRPHFHDCLFWLTFENTGLDVKSIEIREMPGGETESWEPTWLMSCDWLAICTTERSPCLLIYFLSWFIFSPYSLLHPSFQPCKEPMHRDFCTRLCEA